MRRWLDFLGLTLFFTVCLTFTFLAGYYTRALAATIPQLRWPLPGLPADQAYPLLDEARALVEAHFNGLLPEARQLEYGVVRGYVSALGDPYTVFIDPPKAELEAQSLSGEYGGIGVEISQAPEGHIVLKPFFESPAALAGIQAGDRLLAVDTIPLTPTLSLDEVTALIRGPIDTTVALQVRHPDGQTAEVTVRRQRIELPSVTWRLLDDHPDIAVLTLSRFSDRTARELENAGRELQALGATRFVLDLRNNGGGLLDSAVEAAGHFLPGGVVMYETSKNAPEKTYTAAPAAGPFVTAPLAVLVNGNTASAAEILAGALLDQDRAPLIGQKTFGKGSVQFVFPLSDGSSLHVTANLWLTPKRRQLDKIGLPPTIEVQPGGEGADAELARAVDYLLTGQ